MSMILKTILISSLFVTSLAQAQEPNVWIKECKSCHSSYEDLAKKAGIHTEQYYFNLVFLHKNKDGEEFGSILSKKKISLVSRFVLIAAYLHKLETDMRAAGDHLIKEL